MQSFDLPLILCLLLIIAPIAVGLVFWLQYLSKSERPFWLFPREYALPSRSATLFMTGGLLILGAAIFDSTFRPKILDQFAPSPPLSDEFDIERELVKTQYSIALNLAVAIIGAVVVLRLPDNDRKRVGFRTDDLKRQAWYGVQGFLLAVVPVYALVAMILPLKETEEAVHPLLRMITEGNLDFRFVFWACLSAVVVAPIQEEMLYRVLLQEGMVSLGYRLRIAIPGIAVFFCLVHLFPDSIPLFPLAILLGLVMHFRNSFLAVVIMHMLFNAFNILLTILGNLL
jgi:membrane protease YdiL (CAAX protease family)